MEMLVSTADDVPIKSDRVMKPLRGIVTRAQTWNGKARKLLAPGGTKDIDMVRVTQE